MLLTEHTLFGVIDYPEQAIKLLRGHEIFALRQNPAGYYVAFSGGKDSVVALDLVRRAGVEHTVHFHLTTVDPPELLRFIAKHYPDIKKTHPRKSMFDLIKHKNMPPTRTIRYCCAELKERSGSGRWVVTGVRRAESAKRNRRKVVESCLKNKTKFFINPIIDWSEAQVWEYIKGRNLPYCSLYDEGFQRIGCIGCPMKGQKGMQKDFVRWPKFYAAYMRAFETIAQNRPDSWSSAQDVMDWWINERIKIEDSEQMVLFD